MGDALHLRPAALPHQAVGDEQAVAQQRLQRVAHLRRLALEGRGLGDEGLLDRGGVVEHDDAARQGPHVEQGRAVGVGVLHREHVARALAQQGREGPAALDSLREGRDEVGRVGGRGWRAGHRARS